MDELTKLRMAFENFPIETKRYLTEVTLDGKTRLVIKTPTIGSGLEYYLAEYPDIKNFPPEELKNVKDKESAARFAERMRNKPKEKEEALKDEIIYSSHMENGVESVEQKEEDTRDMLVGTGYTTTYPAPLTKVTRDSSEYIVKEGEEPTIVQSVREAFPNGIATPQVTKTPNMAPLAKTKTLAPKEDKQSGFSDVIILGVVVLVYVAIIVNLIIRIK